MEQQARSITTNQIGIHENLHKVVKRHLASSSQKPFSEHTKQAFQQLLVWLDGSRDNIILDSCCGVGESTVNIAKAYPHSKVIGVDKSAMRTAKHQAYSQTLDNYIVLRADLNDFWRLLVLEGLTLDKHFLFYPNPYPKKAQLQKRWHACSAFTDLLRLGGKLEVRSNWKLYIEEFSEALKIADTQSCISQYQAKNAITPFERKYWQSGQGSWQLIADLNVYKNKNS